MARFGVWFFKGPCGEHSRTQRFLTLILVMTHSHSCRAAISEISRTSSVTTAAIVGVTRVGESGEEIIAADCNTGIYLVGETSRRRFSTTKVSAPIMRPDSIQYSAGLPLNRKAVAMIAIAQTSDQTMADVPSFLELGMILGTVARLCQLSLLKSI